MSEWGIIKRPGGRGGKEGKACLGSYIYISACVHCVCVLWKRKEETDRCLAQLYTPIGASAMIVSMKGGSDLHHLCCFYFPVLLESDTDTHRQHTHTHTHSTQTNLMLCRQGCTALTKVQHQLIDKIGFYRSFLFSHSSFCQNLQITRQGVHRRRPTVLMVEDSMSWTLFWNIYSGKNSWENVDSGRGM